MVAVIIMGVPLPTSKWSPHSWFIVLPLFAKALHCNWANQSPILTVLSVLSVDNSIAMVDLFVTGLRVYWWTTNINNWSLCMGLSLLTRQSLCAVRTNICIDTRIRGDINPNSWDREGGSIKPERSNRREHRIIRRRKWVYLLQWITHMPETK